VREREHREWLLITFLRSEVSLPPVMYARSARELDILGERQLP